MHTKSTPWAAALLVALGVFGLSACGQTGTENAKSTETESPTQQATRAPQTTQRKPTAKPLTDEERTQRLLKVIWWNSDQMVKQLGLTDSQRSQLDSLLGEYLAQLRAGRDLKKELQDQLNAAAGAADWSKADEVADSSPSMRRPLEGSDRFQTSRSETTHRRPTEEITTNTRIWLRIPWVRFGAIRRAQQRRASARS